jgi:beta-phosphoglucomutase-like phosphatase (HAD superfamily)
MPGNSLSRITLPLPDRIRAVIFDVDGTLYSQTRLRGRMMAKILRGFLSAPAASMSELRVIRAYRRAHEIIRERGLPVNGGVTQLRMASEMAGVSVATAQAAVEGLFERTPLLYLRACLRPEVGEFLGYARSRGVKLGVVSDYPVEQKLAAVGLMGAFDAAVSSSDEAVNFLKPNPGGLLLCLAKLGVSAREAVYVGDRVEVDGECARTAGVAFGLINGRGNSVGNLFSNLRTRIET